jgi:CubicO group peptidase (beta-lactamase class C family)
MAPSPSSAAGDPLAAAIADVMNSYTTTGNVRAIIVNVNDRTRFERYYSSAAAESRSSYSVTKSVTSTLVGIAISEGRLRLDERLPEMLPRYAAEMKPGVARVTLRQLLTHTAGFTDTFDLSEDQMLRSPDWVRYILAHQDYAPGSEWHYSDHGAHLLAPILVQATGESVLAYARAKPFDPLGIVTRPSAEPHFYPQAVPPAYEKARFAWPIDPQGFHMTEALIKLRPGTWPRSASCSCRPGSRMAGKSCRQGGCAKPRPRRSARRSPISAAWRPAPRSIRQTTDTSGGWSPQPVSPPTTRGGTAGS